MLIIPNYFVIAAGNTQMKAYCMHYELLHIKC